MTMAREGLFDALEALKPHLDALVLVGAQAIYRLFRIKSVDIAYLSVG